MPRHRICPSSDSRFLSPRRNNQTQGRPPGIVLQGDPRVLHHILSICFRRDLEIVNRTTATSCPVQMLQWKRNQRFACGLGRRDFARCLGCYHDFDHNFIARYL